MQEALDRLCQLRDLRRHNKHLHGWGIVCGLQVELRSGHIPEENEANGDRRDGDGAKRAMLSTARATTSIGQGL